MNSKAWKYGLMISIILTMIGIIAVIQIFSKGLGVMDISNYIFWGVLITNFVFWIGISHAGTFISAILLLLKQDWRKSINRSAEAMTIISILIASLLPIIHLGRPGYFYWLLPVSNRTNYFLINFNSPLIWDFYAILTYFIVSLMFFYMGVIPDLGTLRDKSKNKWKWSVYNFFSCGWTGSYKTWADHRKTMFLMAGLITPLVISIHSIVSLDFAVTLNPGWHSTIFPFYFVIGALFSGFAGVSIIQLLVKKYNPESHLASIFAIENINKIVLFTSILLIFIYATEFLYAFLPGMYSERLNLVNKFSGHLWWIYISVVSLTLIIPQFLWVKSIRTHLNKSLLISLLIITGMWFERFMIIIGSKERSYLTGSFINYKTSIYALAITLGTFGLFSLMLMILFRFIPFNSIYENRKSNSKIK